MERPKTTIPTATLVAMLWAAGCASAPPSPSAETAEPTGEAVARQVLVTLAQRPAWRAPAAGSSASRYAPSYEASAWTRQQVRRLEKRYDLRQVDSWPIEVLGVHCVVFLAPPGTDRALLIASLESDDLVETAQPMNLFTTQEEPYDDPYRELQHGVATLQVERAHVWADGSGITVAVVDTGLDVGHPDLAHRVASAKDFVTEGGETFPAERHGTAVAGVIASVAGNGIGIVGVAPGVEIEALRACWAEPDAPGAVCSSFTLAKALAHAVDRRVDVINLSLAGPPDPLLEQLLEAARRRGILVIAARSERPQEHFPSSAPGVVAVSAAGGDGPADANELFAAPGHEIVTTVPGGSYDFVSGSSLAAAHVAGVAALLLQRAPGLDPERVAGALRASADGGPPWTVNACRALAGISPTVDCDAR